MHLCGFQRRTSDGSLLHAPLVAVALRVIEASEGSLMMEGPASSDRDEGEVRGPALCGEQDEIELGRGTRTVAVRVGGGGTAKVKTL